jgi:integrase
VTAEERTIYRADHIEALLDAARELDRAARADRKIGRRPMLATLAFGGLRIGELCALRWRDVDLAAGRLHVRESKTDAGARRVDLFPVLRDELATHKASTRFDRLDDLVFPTGNGRPQNRTNVRQRVLHPAIERANKHLDDRDLGRLPDRPTPHGLLHTVASLVVAVGEDPRYVMDQLGHTDPACTLRLYTHSMRREDGERDRLRRLVGIDVVEEGVVDRADALGVRPAQELVTDQ